jgi:hypothetical protein
MAFRIALRLVCLGLNWPGERGGAVSLVATRWPVFLEAEPESRAWAFACYVAALDAEEAAAADMAALSSRIAA